MQNHWLKPTTVALYVCAGGMAVAAQRVAPAELTADQIVQRTVLRAQFVHTLNKQTNYSYQKTSTVEELDGKGKVKNRKEKVLAFESGLGTLKELKVNGEVLSDRE